MANTSPTLQLLAGFGFRERIGAEAEFLYVPIRLKSTVLEVADFRKSSQWSAVAGPRFTTGRLTATGPGIGYLSLRVGFARIVTRSEIGVVEGEWIGRTIGEIEDPPELNFAGKIRRRAFVFSPRAGFLVKVAPRTAVDLSVFPMFIFHRGEVTRQLFFTASFALTSMQDI